MIYKDKNAPVEERIKDLMERMTLQEKVAQHVPYSLICFWMVRKYQKPNWKNI